MDKEYSEVIFSIIMPVYNAEKTLDKTIQSVLQQTTKDFEFIIVDDGSCDESHKIVSQYAQEDGRVKIICQDNAGPGIARNNGISQSEGDYIAFIDADDYWEKDFLETIIRCSDNNKADLIFVEAVTEYPNGDIANYLNIKKNAGAARERMLSNQMTGKLPWGMFKVIRRDLLEKVNVQFEGYSVGEEAIFSFEILRNAQNVKFADKVIYHYVQNSNGQHTKGDKDPWHPMVTAMKNHLQEIGEYEKYKKSLNSLALKAISIGMYRCTMNTNVTDAIKFMSNLHKEYSEEFDIKTFDKESLDTATRCVLEMLNCKAYLLIYIASRLRKSKQDKLRG
jgi:glycosyltransferase involved in cell wall biosynthesis